MRAFWRGQSAKRRRLIRHLAVGLDKGIALEAAYSAGQSYPRDGACGIKSVSRGSASQGEPAFRKDSCDLDERGGLLPEGRPYFTPRTIWVFSRKNRSGCPNRFERKREGGSATADSPPSSSKRTGEYDGSFHRQNNVPWVQGVRALISSRRITSTLTRTELAHRAEITKATTTEECAMERWSREVLSGAVL